MQNKNAIYLEAGGIGGLGSINYERIFIIKPKHQIAGRIGLSSYSLNDFTNKFNPDVIIPFAIHLSYGNQHQVEIGIGQTISNTVNANDTNKGPTRNTNIHASFNIGYKYQKETGKFLFRCGYTPLIEFYENYRHWAGVSFGYAF